ncbi:hypothetical protein ACFV98_09895 [Streptomyces violascens]|uniref:hypothetical protein n=1 Tax=Streptomyces violascens TaxID=67381 RepID=UPI003664A67A
MTALAIETAAEGGAVRSTGFAITANGSYAARLVRDAGSGAAWFPERWTLDGPEPYAVPLPGNQPEEPDAGVLPMADGRVLIHRRVADRHAFALLYPTGPATGELPLGAIDAGEGEVILLPPSPDGSCAYALAAGQDGTALWLVAGGAFGPEPVARIKGRCSGGAWLDRTGRMLSLDRELDGRTKAVAVDLERGGEVTELLQITEDSNDRLLLADADSGLLMIRSDAPGHDRLGWGVLGSALPIRFPECLRLADAAVTPFAIQPGQVLTPESCAVALRIDAAGGTWVGIWRPAGRHLHQLAAPQGWLAGAGLWTPEGVLRLPYVTDTTPCALLDLPAPPDPAPAPPAPPPAPAKPAAAKPVPLGQAPLTGRRPLSGDR